MKTLFITSAIGTSVKIDGVRKPCPLTDTNQFLTNFKNSLPKRRVALYFASTPATFENNDQYASCIQNSFALSGVPFAENYVVDDRTTNVAELVAKADFIYLMGGRTLVQHEFFERIQLRQLLANFDGVVLGESAGAINMADHAYESREDLNEVSHWFQGLGLTQYNVEPHFAETNVELIEQTLIPDSRKAPFIAIADRSYIMEKDHVATLYGEAWLFQNGAYRQINKINAQQKLDRLRPDMDRQQIK